MSAIYTGPQCPACSTPIDPSVIHGGAMQCPSCLRTFEATPFQPREHRHSAVQVVTETPDGVAAACANHARNAAVTSCGRCGLFICALCEMNTGDATYCPSCFDRMRNGETQGAIGARYRDYAMMAIWADIVGLLCFFMFGMPGALAVYWAAKAMKQRRMEGVSRIGMVLVMIVGILEAAGGLSMIALMIIGMVQGS